MILSIVTTSVNFLQLLSVLLCMITICCRQFFILQLSLLLCMIWTKLDIILLSQCKHLNVDYVSLPLKVNSAWAALTSARSKNNNSEMILIPFCNVSSCICRLGLVTFDSCSCHSLCDSCNKSLRDMHLFAHVHVCFSLQRFLVSRNSILEKNAARLCNIQPHHHVLEVGFGPGIGLQHALQYVQGQLARLCV